ncbi:ubiquitin carboxyl-terminal hydrolase [Holotrichia oblita]|uniref:Ubiquitin carboxyl-terminal hydrolase n=1 Tax=Holotrichia oblita TaxID=644536 RepID=A0ACB9TPY3_HOLOL|nr:ubiquitin carboxyl-terminal hydrolase [Holotrichia oblita]
MFKNGTELKDALQEYKGATFNMAGGGNTPPAQSITAALRDLYSNLPKKSEHGGFTQQDANECWTEMVRMLQQKLPAKASDTENAEKYKSIVDQYFGGSFDVEWKCVETEDESSTKSTEQFLQLSCFISQDVRYMHSGLRSKMQEQITKMSPTLERDAVYTKTSKISRLPAYLTLCSAQLQEKLAPMRTKFKEYEDKLVEEAAKGKDTIKDNNKGDGDWHCAYVLLYGPRLLELPNETEETMTVDQ